MLGGGHDVVVLDAAGQRHAHLTEQKGILAGVRVAERIFQRFDKGIQMELLMSDGDPIKPGDVAKPIARNTVFRSPPV